MSSPGRMLVLCFSLASVGESLKTTETQKYVCKTFGSGVVQPFNGSSFYVRSSCPYLLTRFTHNRVECQLITQRDGNGLLIRVEIIINKVRTVLQDEDIRVEGESVSLPYDHTYQHIFGYGIYTKLRSALIPLSVTWHNVPGGIDTLQVEMEQELNTDMTGLCGRHTVAADEQHVIADSVLPDDTCQTQDPISTPNQECRQFFSHTLDCLRNTVPHYLQLCYENVYGLEKSKDISCAFFKEVAHQCGNSSIIWYLWRSLTLCEAPTCPADLVYKEQGLPFSPSCSHPNPQLLNQDLISSCVCPRGTVLNDLAEGFSCVSASSCPCVFAGKNYASGDIYRTKCQNCTCDGGKWRCSENVCPTMCVVEGQFVTTYDGKQYSVPGKCSYVASQGNSWRIQIEYFKDSPSLKTVTLQLFEEKFQFSLGSVRVGEEEIAELYRSEHALVYWESSMYVKVHTTFGLKVQVQVFPEVELYVTPPANTSPISGLCGNNNKDTTDDFTTSSGIIENSAQPFALSWSLMTCSVNIPSSCIKTDNEIFAEAKCSVLNDATGLFAKCHSHIPTDYYYLACIQRTCNCDGSLQQCLCSSLASYARACAAVGVAVGDWRKASNCTMSCPKNQRFSYAVQACNHTCHSLSGPDPRCGLSDAPVEGCGCLQGTHLNQGVCTPKSKCPCHYHGGTTPPGSAVIDGRQCFCANGELKCAEDCGCKNGKVCVHCVERQINTAQKTCDSLSKLTNNDLSCNSGCYCPHNHYEDHRGGCVPAENCTCMYSGKVFHAGQSVTTNCKTCTCNVGQWHCLNEPCSGKCQVYGNGHYQTFDSKWYRFDGHCQYTLVEDDCGNENGTFSVRVESVPCCDEALTCSRNIIFQLQGSVTLTLSDMKVTRRHQSNRSQRKDLLYSIHTVGLYIMISVPTKGLTLIWDKNTRITVELHPQWRNRVCGLCGNFDSNEKNDLQLSDSAVSSSPLAFGNSWKTTTPPCSDVTTEVFPCERNSYCSAWAQRRCMILMGNTFKDCHLMVDPEPYYHACMQESCSCEYEGKFLGFCTAVAAYAEACSDHNMCVNWRTPDLCPVYCDYYNERGESSWHYEACGEMLTCGTSKHTQKLEGCYPRCSKEAPYYDENTGACSELRNCTCYFNDTIINPLAVVWLQHTQCHCEDGTIQCQTPGSPSPTTPEDTTSAATKTTGLSSTTRMTTMASTTSLSTTTAPSTLPSTTILPTTTTASTLPWTTTTITLPTTITTSTLPTSTTPPTTPKPTALPTTPTTMTTSALPSSTTTTTSTPSSTTIQQSTSIATTAATLLSSTTWPTTIATSSTLPPATTKTTTPTTTTASTEPTTTTQPTSTTVSTLPSTTTKETTLTTITASTEPTTTTPPATTTGLTLPNITTQQSTPTTTLASTLPSPSTQLTTPTTKTTSAVPTATSQPATTMASTLSSTASPTLATTEKKTKLPPTTTLINTSATSETTTEYTITTPSTTSTSNKSETTPSTTTTFATSPTTVSTVVKTTELYSTISQTTGYFPTTKHSIETTELPNPSTSTTTTITMPKTTQLSTTTTPTIQTTSETTLTSTAEHPPISTTEINTNPTQTLIPTVCECVDLKSKRTWDCGETWTEDCFDKVCLNQKIELTPVRCPETGILNCPRHQATKVLEGCCETWKCDCRCDLYGDPHYISFQGVPFDFLDECTYILVEERSPRYNLTIAVENFYCVPDLQGSCVKGIILKYQGNVATLSISPSSAMVQATLNNATIQPPYEEGDLRFQTTEYVVSIHLLDIRSFVSLSPSWALAVSLAMEHFHNNTQGQCGVCGVGSCVRRGGLIEDDNCCEQTAYDWVYNDQLKSTCASVPRDIPCHIRTTLPPKSQPTTTICPASALCELLDSPIFLNCSRFVDLKVNQKNCRYDSCRNGPCPSLEQAADQCKKAGFCIDWRNLTGESCGLACPKGLVYDECRDKLDDFCYGGILHPGPPLDSKSSGCFCPIGQFREGSHSHTCVSQCPYCKGPLGEPRLPGEVWLSNCHRCTCNNRTRMEECTPRQRSVPMCSGDGVLVNTSCCGDQICVERKCHHRGRAYKIGDTWTDAANPCTTFSCSEDGVLAESPVCLTENCAEEDRLWDSRHCCFTCESGNKSCTVKLRSFNVTVDNCEAVIQIPACQGQCESDPSGVMLHGQLQVEHKCRCCQEQTAVRRSVTLQCSDLTTMQHDYRHITACECRACSILR